MSGGANAAEDAIEQWEARLKTLVKEANEMNAAELSSLRLKIRDHYTKLLLSQATTTGNTEASLKWLEKIWRQCFHRIIDEYRKRIPRETSKRKQITSEFRRFLHESTQYFESLNEKLARQPEPSARVLLSLGDLARYREMVSDFDPKRWNEAFDCYLASALLWPENGIAHNQLAVVAAYEKRNFISVYRYQRALACELPFDAAKNNLAQALLTSANLTGHPQQPAKESHLELVLNQTLRLEALLLLPQYETEECEQQLALVKQGLAQLGNGAGAFKRDVSVALILSLCFCLDQFHVLGNALPSSGKYNVALLAFRAFAREFVDQASQELSKPAVAAPSSAAAARALLYVCLLIDFCRAQAGKAVVAVLDDELKSRFDALAGVVLSHARADAAPVDGEFDEEEHEFLGYLPLGLEREKMRAKPSNAAELGGNDALIAFRAGRITAFVRNLMEEDLKPLAKDGKLYSSLLPPPLQGQSASEEEEEILFRPKFKLAQMGAATSSVPMQAFPPLFAQSSKEDWSFLQPKSTTAAAAAAPQSTQSRWAFAAPKPAVRPPPGF